MLIENSNHGAPFREDATLGLWPRRTAPIRILPRIRGMRTMIRTTIAGSLLLWLVLHGPDAVLAQGTDAAQAAGPAASVASAQRILTKNPEYVKLLNPPEGDDYLKAYSTGYQEKAAAIEAKLADINDEKLRSQTRIDEWAQVTKKEQTQFKYEADVAFNEARISFSRAHRDAWFEVGRGTYDDSSHSYVVRPVSTAPAEMRFLTAMSPTTLDQIYGAFHLFVAQEIDQKAREFVSKAGPESNCARNSDFCYQFKKDEIEQALRVKRIVVVGEGDLEQRTIGRYLIVDYDTETILYELGGRVPILNAVNWRFSMGKVLPPPVEPEPVVAQEEPATPALAEPESLPKAAIEDPATGSASEVATRPPVASALPAASTAATEPVAKEAVAKVPVATALPVAPPTAAAPDVTPVRVAIASSALAASILTRTPPKYPAEARANQIHGDVVLRAIIDKEGKISEVHALSGDDVLAQAAVDAVRTWTYKPILSEGEPIEVETTITITFSLAE